MRRTASLLASAALVAVALATGTTTASAGVTPPTANGASIKTSPYVALGDSYSSAAGVAPFDPTAAPECSRSLLNYPHDIAATTKPASFTDVTCSGARTSDFFTAQRDSAGVPINAPQLDAVTKDTRLVTMTIGGNDEGVFVSSFFGCAQLTPTDPTGNPCERKYGSTFVDTIRNQTYPNLVNTLSAVRAKAPRATVVILGYPQILPPQGSLACTAQTSIAVGDVPWLVNQQKVLNDAVRRAAAATGSRYVDTFTQSAGHDACAGTERWMEPLAAPVNAYPIHPNAVGEAKMAEATLAAITR